MQNAELNIVTGAFGYTGRHITRRLLAMGKKIRMLTGHPDRLNPFGDAVEIAPFNFGDPSALTESLRGAATLYNTYWVRFPQGQMTYDKAIENTRTLIKAAEDAGVRRIVHISITNPSEDSPLPYFRGKALLEKEIVASKLSYAIIRPTVIFGDGDILINNIAWLLRRLPVFGVPGSGDYKLQPVYVEDVAEMTVNLGESDENVIVDAAGPDIYTFDELIRLIAETVHRKVGIVHLPPELALFLSRIIGEAVNDVVLTRDEVKGLMADLLVSDGPPTGKTRLSDWLSQNADRVGEEYVSELKRHYR